MRRIGLGALAIAAALTLAACGDDDDGGGGEASTPAAFAVTATGKGAAPTTIEAPTTVKAGLVTMTFKNAGDTGRDAQLIHVEEGRTVKDVLGVVDSDEDGAPIPAWVLGGGGVGQTLANQTTTTTQVLEPGSWVLVVSSDAENSEAVGQPLTVEGEASDATLPATDAKITASEYKFAATGLKPGTNEITFENAGKELHHALAFPVNKGATDAQVRKAMTSDEEPSGPPPVNFEKGVGTTVIDGGQSQVATLSLEAGRYALICFISDRAGGPPHVAKGMLTFVDVE